VPPRANQDSSADTPSSDQAAPRAVPDPEASELANSDHERAPTALPAPEGHHTEIVPVNGSVALPPREVVPDRGLYAVFGLDPTVSDAEIQTSYRRQAARLSRRGNSNNTELRQLNAAYEVLGNPVRRAEYDRARHSSPSGSPVSRTPIEHTAKPNLNLTRRRRPRYVVQPRYAGFGDVVVVLVVVGLAIAAAVLIIPRVSINLSSLNSLSNILPVSLTARRAVETPITPSATRAAPTPTVRPGLADRFAGSTVAVSNATPDRNSAQNIVVRLRRDGQPAANLDVFATLQYRTTEERWPSTGTVKTDASGSATIPFNVGEATPGFQVQVHAFAQIDDQQLSWSTSFTPR
jgi:DnaJ domain